MRERGPQASVGPEMAKLRARPCVSRVVRLQVGRYESYSLHLNNLLTDP